MWLCTIYLHQDSKSLLCCRWIPNKKKEGGVLRQQSLPLSDRAHFTSVGWAISSTRYVTHVTNKRGKRKGELLWPWSFESTGEGRNNVEEQNPEYRIRSMMIDWHYYKEYCCTPELVHRCRLTRKLCTICALSTHLAYIPSSHANHTLTFNKSAKVMAILFH